MSRELGFRDAWVGTVALLLPLLRNLVLSNLAYLTLCRSIQLLALLARADAAKDLEIRHCCIWRPLKPASSTRVPERHRRCQD